MEILDGFSAYDAIAVDLMVSPKINNAALSKCYCCAAITKINDDPVNPLANGIELQNVMSRIPVKDMARIMQAFSASNSVPDDNEAREQFLESLRTKFGKLCELNALEASTADTFRENPNGLALGKIYALAAIRSVNGSPVNPLELDKDGQPTAFNDLAKSISLAEINGLIALFNDDTAITGEQLKNSSAAPGSEESPDS